MTKEAQAPVETKLGPEMVKRSLVMARELAITAPEALTLLAKFSCEQPCHYYKQFTSQSPQLVTAYLRSWKSVGAKLSGL